jgi:hypothetical protein
MEENKQEFLNKVCEALQMTGAACPGIGRNGLVAIKYIEREDGREYASPRFENNPDREDGYYDVNITGDSCIGIWIDLTRNFIKKMW